MKLSRIIWNISRLCYWDCSFCCVDAYNVSWKDNVINVKSNELGKEIKKKKELGEHPFETANRILQEAGKELILNQKLGILDNIDVETVIDFSGGDPLLVIENLLVMEKASDKFGRDNLVVTTTGVGLARTDLEQLARYVGVVGFTYDHNAKESPFRPRGYNYSNLNAIRRLSGLGVKTSAQLPISRDNLDREVIRQIYLDLRDARVDEIHLMRALPVGRGVVVLDEQPTDQEYMNAVAIYQKMEGERGTPRLAIQTALRHPDQEIREFHAKNLLCSSFNITHQGILTLSPWAYDQNGQPLAHFVVGDIKEKKFTELYKEGMRTKLEDKLKNENK